MISSSHLWTCPHHTGTASQRNQPISLQRAVDHDMLLPSMSCLPTNVVGGSPRSAWKKRLVPQGLQGVVHTKPEGEELPRPSCFEVLPCFEGKGNNVSGLQALRKLVAATYVCVCAIASSYSVSSRQSTTQSAGQSSEIMYRLDVSGGAPVLLEVLSSKNL